LRTAAQNHRRPAIANAFAIADPDRLFCRVRTRLPRRRGRSGVSGRLAQRRRRRPALQVVGRRRRAPRRVEPRDGRHGCWDANGRRALRFIARLSRLST